MKKEENDINNGLPKGWEWNTLKSISKFIDYRGKTPTKTEEGIPLITAKNVRPGYINLDPKEYIAISDYNSWMTRGFPNKGDLIFTTEAPLGYIAELNFDHKIALAQRVIVLQTIDNSYIPIFLKYQILSSEFQKKLDSSSTGTTVKGIKASVLKELKVKLPPLPEQQRIVSQLDALFLRIDKAIELTKENLQHSKHLLPSALNEVFGGAEKKGWQMKSLKTLCKIIGGGTPSKQNSIYYENGTINWASVRDMNVDIIETTELKITTDALKKSSSNIIPKGNLIIATRVGLGKVCKLNIDLAINQDLKGIIPFKELSVDYLYYWFKSISSLIINAGTGATVKGVKLDFINALEIPLPNLPTQQKIVNYLNQLSNKQEQLVAHYTKQLQQLQSLKASLLDGAFRGEV